MSSQNEKVKATEFSLADPMPASIQKAPPSSSSTYWVVPALAGLVVLALIVVFWLPGKLDVGDITPAPTDTPQSENSAAAGASPKKQIQTEEASPWSDAQLAKHRKDAQNVLAILLDVQFELQEKGVEQWASEQFDTAKALAQQGDTQYRERDFVAAKCQCSIRLIACEWVSAISLPSVMEPSSTESWLTLPSSRRSGSY